MFRTCPGISTSLLVLGISTTGRPLVVVEPEEMFLGCLSLQCMNAQAPRSCFFWGTTTVMSILALSLFNPLLSQVVDHLRGSSSRSFVRAPPPCSHPFPAPCMREEAGDRCKKRTSLARCCCSIRAGLCLRDPCRRISLAGIRAVGECAVCRP